MKMLGKNPHDNQGAKGPEEDPEDMRAHDVFPEVFLEKMIGYGTGYKQGHPEQENQGDPNPVPYGRSNLSGQEAQDQEEERRRQDRK